MYGVGVALRYLGQYARGEDQFLDLLAEDVITAIQTGTTPEDPRDEEFVRLSREYLLAVLGLIPTESKH